MAMSHAEEKKYTEEEFKKAVAEQVEAALKKTGQDKISSFAKELLTKESQLKMDAFNINKEKEELELGKKDFEKRVQDLLKKQGKILGCLDEQDKLREKRVEHMVDVISNMRPQNAAQVLSVQEAEISISILGKLDALKVSKIFNLMDKEISARLQKQYMDMKK